MNIDWSKVETAEDKIASAREQLISSMETSVDKHIDQEVQSRGYRDADAIGKYLGYDNTYRAECEKLGAWAAACYDKCYELLAIGEELTVDELIAQLPKL